MNFAAAIKCRIAAQARRGARTFAARALALALLACLAAQTTHAADNSVYASTLFPPYTIYEVNTATGALTSVGTLSFSSAALARRSSDGLVFYTEFLVSNGRVAVWNPATNTNTTLGRLGNGVRNFPKLAFNAAGTLYGMDDEARLYTVNTTTGRATLVGTISGLPDDIRGDIAFAPNGTLYAVQEDNSRLYTINIGARSATLVGSTGLSNLAGLAFATGGNLYATESDSPNSLSIINTATGGGSPVSSQSVALYDFAAMPKFANLSVTKTAAGPFVVGTPAVYTLTVSNAGPHSASGPITITDMLPAGLTYSSSTGAGWSCSAAGQTVTCTNAGPLANGASSTLTLRATVSAAAVPTVTNTATVSSTTFDHAPANNTSSVTTAVTAPPTPPNVVLTKSGAANGTPVSGTDITYTINFNNAGGSPASALIISDKIPPDTEFKLGSVTYAPGTSGLAAPVIEFTNLPRIVGTEVPPSPWVNYVPPGAPGTYDGQITYVRFRFAGNLAPNTSGSVTFTVRIR